MHPRRGAYVFAARLVMYRLLVEKYFLVVYTEGRIFTGLVSFSDLLDMIPLHSVPLTVPQPLLATVDETIDAWFNEAYAALRAHVGTSGTSPASQHISHNTPHDHMGKPEWQMHPCTPHTPAIGLGCPTLHLH
jgi:hypothetical protein